jgi:RNA polymerase sigma-70 factor (ECF subfamily)
VESQGDPVEAPESALVAAARQGEAAAFSALVARYQTPVYNLAYRMLGDPDEAADATQEAFLRAYQALGQYRGGPFRAWLLRIAANACYDSLRRRQRRPTASLDRLPHEQVAGAQVSPDPEEVVLQREHQALIQRCLLALPPDQRLVVVLADIQGLSYEEIAVVTRSPLGTVRSRLSRGRARLRDLLRAQPELSPLFQRPKDRSLPP